MRNLITGRPRISNSALIESVREGRFVSTSQLATTHNMSVATVRRRLKEAGLLHRVLGKNAHITLRQKLKDSNSHKII